MNTADLHVPQTNSGYISSWESEIQEIIQNLDIVIDPDISSCLNLNPQYPSIVRVLGLNRAIA